MWGRPCTSSPWARTRVRHHLDPPGVLRPPAAGVERPDPKRPEGGTLHAPEARLASPPRRSEHPAWGTDVRCSGSLLRPLPRRDPGDRRSRRGPRLRGSVGRAVHRQDGAVVHPRRVRPPQRRLRRRGRARRILRRRPDPGQRAAHPRRPRAQDGDDLQQRRPALRAERGVRGPRRRCPGRRALPAGESGPRSGSGAVRGRPRADDQRQRRARAHHLLLRRGPGREQRPPAPRDPDHRDGGGR